MKLLKQFGYLRLPGRGGKPLEEDGRVLHLFRNRAELKKQYSELQDEIHRLKDRIKQQEGVTARVQESLDGLRERLASSATGYPTLVFYQLRDLWSTGHALLEQFVRELTQQQEERERRAFLAEFNRRLFVRREAADKQLRAAEAQSADVREKLQALQRSRAAAARWWQYFRRRELDRRLHSMSAEQAGVDASLTTARDAFAAIEAETAGEFPGLSLEARRAINLAGIACAEVLCQRLARTQLVSLAKAASARREAGEDYGDAASCTALMTQIARGKALLQQKDTLEQQIRVCSERMKSGARYRAAMDVVPVEDSLQAAQLESVVGGDVGPPPINALGDDLWDVYRVLLR